MIFKKEKINFKKELIFYSNFSGIFVDFTYGNGYHSKIFLKNKKNTLISYEIDKKIKNKYSKIFYNNKCYTNFLKLKTKKIQLAILDFGYNLNQIKNYFSYKNLLSIENFSKEKNIINFFNFEEKDKIFNKIRRFENLNFSKIITKNILEYRKKIIIKNTKQFKNIIYKILKNKKKKNIFSKFFNSIKNFDSKKKKINKLLDYTSETIKQNGYLIIITYNSFESNIFKNFYKKNYKKYEYKIFKKKNFIMRVLKKK
ncbi:16S rRNA (cytosine(1402)-N(4))-methyltransferase [Candidatus Vidania fulgoroideorum]